MSRTMIYFFFFFLLLLSAGCSNQKVEEDRDNLLEEEKSEVIDAKIGILYTNALQFNTRMIFFNEKGEDIKTVKISDEAIFQVIQQTNGDLVLPSQFGDKIVHISKDGRMEKESTLEFPLYMDISNDVRITSYNTELYRGTLQITEDGDSKNIILDGFLRVIKHDSKYIYVFATIIDKEQPVLYVIERENINNVKQLPLEIDLANDLLVLEDSVIISSIESNNKIGVLSKDNIEVNYKNLTHSSPEFLFEKDDKIYITHSGQNVISILDKNTMEEVKSIETKIPAFKAKLKGDSLYLMAQGDNIDNAGVVIEYDINSWKIKSEMIVPFTKKNYLIQDFIIF
jgi:hypothetical protein